MNARSRRIVGLLAVLLSGCTLAPPTPDLPVSSGPAPGVDPASAPLRVTVFFDFGCQSCGRIFRDLEALRPAYEGKVVVVPRDFITEGINPGAYQAAVAMRCANEQGKGALFAEKAFAFTGDWFQLPPEEIPAWAAAAGVDVARFDACRAAPEQGNAIAADVRDGKLLRVTKTPTVFLGSSRVEDPGSLDAWRELLDRTLNVTTRGASTVPSSDPSAVPSSGAASNTAAPSSPAPAPSPG